MRPIFMDAHATIARSVPGHRSLDVKGTELALLLSALVVIGIALTMLP